MYQKELVCAILIWSDLAQAVKLVTKADICGWLKHCGCKVTYE